MTKIEILKQLIDNGNKTRFAERQGISRQHLNNWLNGDRNIQISTLGIIARKEGYKLNVELKLEKI